MADKFTVDAESATSFEKADAMSKEVNTYKKGNEVTGYEAVSGKDKKKWVRLREKGDEWIKMEALKKLSTATFGNKQHFLSQEELDRIGDNMYQTGTGEGDYDELLMQYVNAFGAPPKYTEKVDPYYGTTSETGIGREMMKTFYSNPAILSIQPGSVDYLPGFNQKKAGQKLFRTVKDALGGGKNFSIDKAMGTNGQLYEFISAYGDYMNIVNLLARTVAMGLNIGDETKLMKYSPTALKYFDYGYYSTPGGGSTGVFDEIKRAVSTAVTDDQYIHFFVNHSAISQNESISSTSKTSWLESVLGSESDVSQAAEQIQFLVGGAIGGDASKEITSLLEDIGSSSTLLKNLATVATNYMKGGKLVFPKIITGMNYSKQVSCELTFMSPNGDKRSIFKYVLLPCLHLLALATPKQLTGNMYTYPFLVRAQEKGNFIIDLGFISQLDFNRGGTENIRWTADGLPSEITARFTITPLYSNLMMSTVKNLGPFYFAQNSTLIEYLANMCALDIKVNYMEKKMKIITNLIAGSLWDKPTNLARGIGDTKIMKEIGKFTKLL